MKRSGIKVVSVVLLATVLTSLMTACGSSANKNKDAQGTSNAATKAGPPVEMTIEVFDRALPGLNASENFQTKWIQEKFGTPNNIKITFISVPRSEEVKKLGVLMAAGEAPDICFTYDIPTVVKYGTSGGLNELTDALKKTPNLTKFLGEKVLSYGNWNGSQYAIPAKRPITAAQAPYIRKDWLDKLGLPLPKTREEWYQAMKAFKEKDPGNVGKDKVIPFAVSTSVTGFLDQFISKKTEEEHFTLPEWAQPGAKEGMKFLNKLYNEGLMSPQFALDKNDSQMNKDMSQGRGGFMLNLHDYPLRSVPGIMAELKKNVPDANLVPVDCLQDYAGKYNKVTYDPNGMYIMIPKSSKRLTEAMKYLDWMAQSENLFYLFNGEKGIHYTDVTADGIPSGIIPNDKLPDDKKMNAVDIAIISNGKDFGSEEKNIKAAALTFPGFEDIYKQAYKISMTDTYTRPRFDTIIESDSKYSAALGPKKDALIVKSITCKPEEFDKTYDSLLKEYMDAGGQAIVDEKKAAYAKMKKK